jgi:hypothetical protein
MRLECSGNVTSKTQCNWFSMLQWPRMSSASFRTFGGRLDRKYVTCPVSLPSTTRDRIFARSTSRVGVLRPRDRFVSSSADNTI